MYKRQQLAKRLTQKDKQLAADSHELRIKELVQLRNDQVTIHTGDLAGRLLVDVLTEDLDVYKRQGGNRADHRS